MSAPPNNSKAKVEKLIDSWRTKLDEYKCPISHQLMINPVIIETGQTFDKFSIEHWLKNYQTCPTTGIKLKTKNLIPNYTLKSTINKKVKKFVKKVIENVSIWLEDESLILICKDIVNEAVNFILQDDNSKDLMKELQNLKFLILLNQKNLSEEKLLDEFLTLIKNSNDLFSLQALNSLQLNKLEEKLTKETNLYKYLIEMLNILKNNYLLLKDIFTKYILLNKLDDHLIEKILSRIDNDNVIEFLSILFSNVNYSRNKLLQKLMNIKINDKNRSEFIKLFKKLFKEINLTHLNLHSLIKFIQNYEELKEEIKLIYLHLFEETKDILYLEKIYILNRNDKNIEQELLNAYLKLEMMDKYINMYFYVNQNKIDPIYLAIFKSLTNKIKNLENTVDKLNYYILDQQMNEKIKNNYPLWKDDFIKIIRIDTPSNIKKDEDFYSTPFEAHGLKWNICMYPKGDDRSNEGECAIFLRLTDMKFKEEKKLIASIKIKFLVGNVNLDESSVETYEYEYTKLEGYGSWGFKQQDYIPMIYYNTQSNSGNENVYNIVIGIKKLDIKFKPSTKEMRYPTFLKTTINPPSNASTLVDLPPSKRLELEYIYGSSKKNCKGRIMHFNNNGELIYPAAGCCVVLNIEQNTQKIFRKHNDDVSCIAKHPDGQIFCSGQVGKDDMIYIWDSSNPSTTIQEIDSYIHFKNGGVIALAFSNNGEYLAAVGGPELDSMLLVYRWRTKELIGQCKANRGEVFEVVFTPDDTKIILCGGNSAKLFELQDNFKTRALIFSPRGTVQPVLCSCFDNKGNLIAGVKDGSIYAFSGNKLVYKQQMHSGSVLSIARTEEGFVSGGKDGMIIWWRFTGEGVEGVDVFKQVSSLNVGSEVKYVIVDKGEVFAAKSNGDIIRTNGTETETVLLSHFGDFKSELWGLNPMNCTPLFVSAGDDGRIILWDMSSRKHVQQVKACREGLRAVTVSPDNLQIAASSKNGSLYVFQVSEQGIVEQPIAKKKDALEEVAAISFSPNGLILALGSHDNNIYLYKTSNYELIGKLCGHTSYVKHLDFTTDSKYLRTSSGDYEVLLWDLSTNKRVDSKAMEDLNWATVSVTLSWSVRGIWKSDMDGTDINGIDVSFANQLVASAEDTSRISLLHYPTVTTKPKRDEYIGHCSHVTTVKFHNNYLLSAGGADLTVFQWKIV
ncbi:hypothetical protein ABK040_005985 [Willaertia magna]